jgi:hypothetical protein
MSGTVDLINKWQTLDSSSFFSILISHYGTMVRSTEAKC